MAEKSRNVAAPTLAAYRDLAERGQVEFCTSPYYHPILPLLVDTASAHEATPGLPLPPTDFAYPEDALEQVRRAMLAHETTFGRTPHGMWPSEGAVSQGVADLLARHTDLRWIASDEAHPGTLAGPADRSAMSYGHVTNPRLLYQPYAVATQQQRPPARPLTIVFRDRVLSDRIGFVYQHMNGRDGAARPASTGCTACATTSATPTSPTLSRSFWMGRTAGSTMRTTATTSCAICTAAAQRRCRPTDGHHVRVS